MKANIKSKARKRGLVYRLSWYLAISAWCFIIPTQNIDAQELTKKFTDEISIENENIFIETNGTNYGLRCSGTISITQSEELITISDESRAVRFIVDRNTDIKTHSGNTVKYVTNVITSGPDAAALLQSLKYKLQETMPGYVSVNCLLNIQDFHVTNGWFRPNKNAITLEDGSSHEVEKFSIATTIWIPEKANLILSGKRGIGFNVGKLNGGKLSVILERGTLNCSSVTEVEADLKNSEASFESVEKGKFELQQGKLNIRDAKDLTLKSYLSKVNIDKVDSLRISNTSNDKFYFGEIQAIRCRSSWFSNYEIGKLHKSLDMKLVNGDISVKEIQTNFEKVRINNEVSTIRLGIEKLKKYSVLSSGVNNTEFEGLEEISFLDNQNSSTSGQKLGGKIILSCENCKVIFEDW